MFLIVKKCSQCDFLLLFFFFSFKKFLNSWISEYLVSLDESITVCIRLSTVYYGKKYWISNFGSSTIIILIMSKIKHKSIHCTLAMIRRNILWKFSIKFLVWKYFVKLPS